VRDVQVRANRSNEEVGEGKNVLDEEPRRVLVGSRSNVRSGSHKGVTPGAKRNSLPSSSDAAGEKHVKRTCRNVGNADPIIGASISDHSRNSARVTSLLAVVGEDPLVLGAE
jgi:hypothetical protein